MLIQYSPNPHSYAAIRINHVATVEHFPFPDIIESARKIQPKTYLVFLNTALSIPFPQDPWFPFIVNPIAPFPPPMEGHVTSEMCIPIYPNTSHPSGRAAVHTEPPFPYDNCYHWSSARDVGVRVRPRQTGHFDDDIAVKTRIRDERELWRMVARDCTKVEEATRRDVPDGFPSGPPETQPEATARPSTPDTALGPEDGHGSMIGGAPEACSGSEGHGLAGHEGITETEDATDADAQSCASDDAISDFQALVGMGIFGTRLDNKDDYPLVDVWLELADQLKQEDIPDPRDFYVECNTLVQLVWEAQRRLIEERKSLDCGADRYSDDEAATGHGVRSELAKKEERQTEEHGRCWPSTREAFQKFRMEATRAVACAKRALRLPCLSALLKKISCARTLG